jgi:3-isopropylmalate/(R)-2-methylmalate dehydratase small subunit
MIPLVKVEGQGLSLPDADVDTDIIYPARFLLITDKKGLGRYAFHDRRDTPDFPLAPGVDHAPPVLVAGPNFGCGSSREQAPWALAGLGIRVIIAESFGEIFFSNCFKNGQLAICFDTEIINRLRTAIANTVQLSVDLVAKTLTIGDGPPIPFAVDDGRREALLNGWNDISRIRALHGADIARFEKAQQQSAPWLWTKG